MVNLQHRVVSLIPPLADPMLHLEPGNGDGHLFAIHMLVDIYPWGWGRGLRDQLLGVWGWLACAGVPGFGGFFHFRMCYLIILILM